jgi:alanyl-tRNA synthetase
MEAKQIRSQFLSFFEQKAHHYVASAPLVVQNDPTLMFTNAGMDQFKDYFLGNKPAPWARVANSQKCLRVSGKHNDLEDVGLDTYHHTMFEMLGNWSFGDYFKKEAIAWAWELLTDVYELPKDRLYATVFEGDQQDGLAFDQEAFDYWKAFLPEERILGGNKKDNFWEMGDTGPCGPCSEIHIDLRPQSEIDKKPGRELVNQDHPLVVEIWNLVFMQFNRMADGSLKSLPAQHVDTGMGFERLCMAIQGKKSNYDTDVFTPLIKEVAAFSGKNYGEAEKIDIAMRVIVDHIRAITFTIADGQLSSNNKAGYVIRRILRRAVRYGYTFLGLNEPFLFRLVPVLAEQFDGVFPEVKSQQDFIARVIMEEELAFLRTLENGLRSFQQIKDSLEGKIIDGAKIFELYDTYGFPYDLTALLAREQGLQLDEEGFKKALNEQKDRSRKAAEQEKSDWMVVKAADEDIRFIGYDALTANSHLLRYREIKEKNKTYFQLVVDVTPFYAESGGQVGDTGFMHFAGEAIRIWDTRKENDLIIHFCNSLPSDLEAEIRCEVDGARRIKIRSNHSATHLLHAALREVLGQHVQQKGSLVAEDGLRFDFSHFAKLSGEELLQIENRVNEKIRENISLNEQRNVPLAQAKSMGATALFGEKYGEEVRVITFDPSYSVELCGGTHVPATGTIGAFKIIAESAVAAGVRRIEAITGEAVLTQMREAEEVIREIMELTKATKDPQRAVAQLLKEKEQLQKTLEEQQNAHVQQLKKDLKSQLQDAGGVQYLITHIKLPNADSLKNLSFELRNELSNPLIVLGAEIDGKPMIAVVLGEDIIREKGLHAGTMVKSLARHIQGGGGGQPFFATAGGKHLDGLAIALDAAKKAYLPV